VKTALKPNVYAVVGWSRAEMRISMPDIDDFEIEVAQRKRAALLANITIPKHHSEPGWVLVVETLMSRGVTTAAHLADVLDQPYARCQAWCEDVRQRWRDSVPSEIADERREELYQRVMAVADMSVLAAQGMRDDAGAKPKYLKTALAAYDKAGDLAGVKKVEVKVEGQVDLVVRKPREVLGEFGVERLRDLGARAARGLKAKEMAEIEEAEVVEEGVDVVEEVLKVVR